AEPLVDGADGAVAVLGPDHAGDADRRGRDHVDVDALGRERVEHVGGHAGVAFDPRAYERELRDRIVGLVAEGTDVGHDALEHRVEAVQIGAGDREAQVGAAVVRDVLHDHVDVDALGGDRLEDRGRDPGAVGDLVQGDLGFLDVQGDAPDQRALEHPGGTLLAFVFVDPGAGLVPQGVPNVDPDAVPPSVLHAPQLEDPRPGCG